MNKKTLLPVIYTISYPYSIEGNDDIDKTKNHPQILVERKLQHFNTSRIYKENSSKKGLEVKLVQLITG